VPTIENLSLVAVVLLQVSTPATSQLVAFSLVEAIVAAVAGSLPDFNVN